MGTKHFVVGINPNAAFGKHQPAGDRVVQALQSAGHRVTAVQRQSYLRLEESLREELDKPEVDGLIMVGGDGMVHLGANLVAETELPFTIFPSGTGNDFADVLGAPFRNPDASLRWLLQVIERSPKPVDAIRMRHHDGRIEWVASSVSGGFDARVNERANLIQWPKGKSRYTLAILLELAKLKPLEYQIRIDDGDEEIFRGMLISVSNIGQFGGGMLITPGSVIDDGVLELLLVAPLSRIAFLRIYPKVFKGTHVTDPRVRIVPIRSVELDTTDAVAYGDGERLGAYPARFEVAPGALQVYY